MNSQEPEKFNFDGLFILEMANNHQGSMEHGKNIIAAYAPVVAAAGVRAAMKFQFRDLDTFIHPDFRDSAEYKHIPRFLGTRLTKDEFGQLVEAAREAGFISMATPSDEASVDLMNELGVEVVKIASASAPDWPLLEKIAAIGKPVVCSTGGMTLEEVDNLVSFFQHRGVDFALMHCVAIYPTPNYKHNLERVRVLSERHPKITIGFSTHEDPDNTEIIKLAYAKGARVFERHIGLPTDIIKLNAYSSAPDQLERWLDSYNDAVEIIGSEAAAATPNDPDERDALVLQMRGAYATRRIKKGQAISAEDVFFAMPLQDSQLPSGRCKPGLLADRDYEAREALSVAMIPAVPKNKEIIYQALHKVKAMLNLAKVSVNEEETAVTVIHPDGLENFFSCGAVGIDVIESAFGKRLLVMLPGQVLPRRYHKGKEKTFQVLSGSVDASLAERPRIFHPGDVFSAARGVWYGFSTPKGAIIEELSLGGIDDDSYYADKTINHRPPADRETPLVRWGRHQFDNQ